MYVSKVTEIEFTTTTYACSISTCVIDLYDHWICSRTHHQLANSAASEDVPLATNHQHPAMRTSIVSPHPYPPQTMKSNSRTFSLLPRLTSPSSTSYLRLPLPAPAIFRSVHTIPRDTVKLAYDYVPAPSSASPSSSSSPDAPPSAGEQSLVICHGLLGSKQNWRSLSKVLAQRLDMRVFVLVSLSTTKSTSQTPQIVIHSADWWDNSADSSSDVI